MAEENQCWLLEYYGITYSIIFKQLLWELPFFESRCISAERFFQTASNPWFWLHAFQLKFVDQFQWRMRQNIKNVLWVISNTIFCNLDNINRCFLKLNSLFFKSTYHSNRTHFHFNLPLFLSNSPHFHLYSNLFHFTFLINSPFFLLRINS